MRVRVEYLQEVRASQCVCVDVMMEKCRYRITRDRVEYIQECVCVCARERSERVSVCVCVCVCVCVGTKMKLLAAVLCVYTFMHMHLYGAYSQG